MMLNRTLYEGDNWVVLRALSDACVDLVYMDPPFNKDRVFASPLRGGECPKVAAFEDIFQPNPRQSLWLSELQNKHPALARFIQSIAEWGDASYAPYLTYMAIRLLEIHRILKDTGSLYLHCDTTMSHYLRGVLDAIFSPSAFRNEIVWHYKGTGLPKRFFPRKHDSILFYAKGVNEFNPLRVPAAKASGWTGAAEKWCDDTWSDIRTVFQSQERKNATGYPTQKPMALLKRILEASTREGDWVLDPFCGSGTTCVVAEQLKRKWIGIDHSPLALEVLQKRINKGPQQGANTPKKITCMQVQYLSASQNQNA